MTVFFAIFGAAIILGYIAWMVADHIWWKHLQEDLRSEDERRRQEIEQQLFEELEPPKKKPRWRRDVEESDGLFDL